MMPSAPQARPSCPRAGVRFDPQGASQPEPDQILEQHETRGAPALSSLRARSDGVKPRPSSATTSRVVACSRRVTSTRTELGSHVDLRVAYGLTRHTVDQHVGIATGARPPPESTCSSVSTPSAASGLSRSLSTTSSPAASRGSAGGSRPAASAGPVRPAGESGRRVSQRRCLALCATALGRPRSAAPARTRHRPGPAPRRRGGRPRSAAAPATRPRPRCPSRRSRSACPRASPRAIDHASGS